jgi:hypothetical protein
MTSLKSFKILLALVGIEIAAAAPMVAESANAAGALFRAKRYWWVTGVGWWTDGHVVPTSAMGPSYQPPATLNVGSTTPMPGFTAPKSFIKNTTYTFKCGPGAFKCFTGYPKSSGWYSYWNAKGSFRPSNGPTTTTTVRVRTTADGYDPSLMGWPSVTETLRTAMGQVSRTVMHATPPPTAGYSRITPTEGGCTGPIALTLPPASGSCPGTTQFSGRYQYDRGGSIMIWPGRNRFGGTLRFLQGPNARFYQLITIEGPYTAAYFTPPPLSKQLGTGDEFAIGGVELWTRGYRFMLTEPYHVERRVIGVTPSGGDCTSIDGGPDCRYIKKTAQYLITGAPYTTGMVQAWEPNGNTNTIQTATGYDNRTPAGLNGTISMVHPRLLHSYVIDQSVDPNNPIRMAWSTAAMRRIDFRMLPEPAAFATLVSGALVLICLCCLRVTRLQPGLPASGGANPPPLRPARGCRGSREPPGTDAG